MHYISVHWTLNNHTKSVPLLFSLYPRHKRASPECEDRGKKETQPVHFSNYTAKEKKLKRKNQMIQ